MFYQQPGKFSNVSGDVFQRGDFTRKPDFRREFAKSKTLQRKQIPLGHYSDEPCIIHHKHMPDAVADHCQRCLVGERMGRKRKWRAGHELGDGSRIQTARNGCDQIAFAKDP